MKRTLIVIDMQNDFVTGSLKNPAAQAIIPNIKRKITEYECKGDEIIFTRDTHKADYLNTPEGKSLPVPHCINGTWGWLVVDELNSPEYRHINKPTFGYKHWDFEFDSDDINIELVVRFNRIVDRCYVYVSLVSLFYFFTVAVIMLPIISVFQ